MPNECCQAKTLRSDCAFRILRPFGATSANKHLGEGDVDHLVNDSGLNPMPVLDHRLREHETCMDGPARTEYSAWSDSGVTTGEAADL